MKIDGSAHNSVGVSLLAIAVGQLNNSLTDTTPSRAGSLPQGLGVGWRSMVRHKTVWERACSRMRWIRRWRCWMCRPLREQARSHRDWGVN